MLIVFRFRSENLNMFIRFKGGWNHRMIKALTKVTFEIIIDFMRST